MFAWQTWNNHDSEGVFDVRLLGDRQIRDRHPLAFTFLLPAVSDM